MATPRVPQCPALPLEMWARIFTFVDEVDLWVTCRQVSQALRAEAERESAKNRLQHMQIIFGATAALSLSGAKRMFTTAALVKGFMHLSSNDLKSGPSFLSPPSFYRRGFPEEDVQHTEGDHRKARQRSSNPSGPDRRGPGASLLRVETFLGSALRVAEARSATTTRNQKTG